MATLPKKYREPAQIVQGSTISFTRNLKDYPASKGWSLVYSMRGGMQPIQFVSTPNGDEHNILVASGVTGAWAPAEYELQGTAVNVDGTKEPVYMAYCPVLADDSTLPGGANIKTHAQVMLDNIEQQLVALAKNQLDETDVEGTRIKRVQRQDLMMQRNKYRRERQGEIARERSKMGLPTGRKIKDVYNIMTPGTAGIAPIGAGPDNPYNYWP